MSKEHPTPWKFDINDADEPIKDANGERVFATDDGFLGPDDDTIREIVDAVNERAKFKEARMEFPDLRPVIIAAGQRDAAIAERDRLRDIVRRLVSSLSVHHSAAMATVMANREEFDTPDIRKDIDADTALLREARAAIGEGKP